MEMTTSLDSLHGNVKEYAPGRVIIIKVEFLSNEAGLNAINLSTERGKAIKTKFAKDVADAIYKNILNHQ